MIAPLSPSPLRGRGSGRGLAIAFLFLTACEPEPAFPADYAKSYVEVRNCRFSAEHDSHLIRILASPTAAAPYQNRDAGFPLGAVVIKEEREFGDLDCTGPVLQWTVMIRPPDGGADGWHYQAVSADRRVTSTNEGRCIGCHAECGTPPDGFEGTCAVP